MRLPLAETPIAARLLTLRMASSQRPVRSVGVQDLRRLAGPPALRNRRGFSQAALAQVLEVSPSYLNQIEYDDPGR